MIIDIHSHLFPDSFAEIAISKIEEVCDGNFIAVTKGTRDALKESMLESGIDLSVNLPVATKVGQVNSINSKLIQEDNVISFGALHPDDETFRDVIEKLVDRGVKGVKLHPEYQDFYITDEKYSDFWKALENSNLIVVLHSGYDPGPFSRDHATPKMISEIITKFPKLILVSAHLGGLLSWDEVYSELAGKNLYLDTSAIAPDITNEQFEKIVKKHGVDKILFGSDSPWLSQKEALDFIRKQEFLSSSDIDKILGLNSKKLLQ